MARFALWISGDYQQNRLSSVLYHLKATYVVVFIDPFVHYNFLQPRELQNNIAALQITVNGTAFDIGGCVGQPSGHYEFWTPDAWSQSLASNPKV